MSVAGRREIPKAFGGAAAVTAPLFLITPEDSGPAPQFHESLSRSLPGFAGVETDLFRAGHPSGTFWLMSRNGFHIGVSGKLMRARVEEVLAKAAKKIPPT